MPRFLPKIMKAARTLADLAGNWRLVWAGALADNRSLRGRDGEYRVAVLPPLQVTDDGVAIDLRDERWRLIATAGGSGAIAGGLQYSVLRKRSDEDYDVEWLAGPVGEIEIVVDVRYDLQAHALQKRMVAITVVGGLITEIGDVSQWTTISGGQAGACEDR